MRAFDLNTQEAWCGQQIVLAPVKEQVRQEPVVVDIRIVGAFIILLKNCLSAWKVFAVFKKAKVLPAILFVEMIDLLCKQFLYYKDKIKFILIQFIPHYKLRMSRN